MSFDSCTVASRSWSMRTARMFGLVDQDLIQCMKEQNGC
jgi:hypothetical protein